MADARAHFLDPFEINSQMATDLSFLRGRCSDLEAALRDMHKMVHDHVFRSGTPKGFPDGSRIIGPEVLGDINDILRKALGRDDPSLKYFRFPDDPVENQNGAA